MGRTHSCGATQRPGRPACSPPWSAPHASWSPCEWGTAWQPVVADWRGKQRAWQTRETSGPAWCCCDASRGSTRCCPSSCCMQATVVSSQPHSPGAALAVGISRGSHPFVSFPSSCHRAARRGWSGRWSCGGGACPGRPSRCSTRCCSRCAAASSARRCAPWPSLPPLLP